MKRSVYPVVLSEPHAKDGVTWARVLGHVEWLDGQEVRLGDLVRVHPLFVRGERKSFFVGLLVRDKRVLYVLGWFGRGASAPAAAASLVGVGECRAYYSEYGSPIERAVGYVRLVRHILTRVTRPARLVSFLRRDLDTVCRHWRSYELFKTEGELLCDSSSL